MVVDTCRALASLGVWLGSGKDDGMILVPSVVLGCNFMQYPIRYLPNRVRVMWFYWNSHSLWSISKLLGFPFFKTPILGLGLDIMLKLTFETGRLEDCVQWVLQRC